MKKTNENGITLIALVVTIVVLLILAGITITYVLADDGVFGTAKEAAVATTAGQVQDYAVQLQSTVMTQNALKSALGTLQQYTPTGEAGADEVVDYTELTNLHDSAKVQKFFPEALYTVGKTDALTNTKGVLGGSFNVLVKNAKQRFKVTFSNGGVTVTLETENTDKADDAA